MSYTEIKCQHVVGRKEYRCEWCNEKILKGEKHMSRAYIFDGDFGSGRMHLECEIAMGKAPHDIVSEGWMPGEFARGESEPR